MICSEKLLHFIWRYSLYSVKNLKTTNGEPISIISPGILNKNAGPDFELAIIRIGDTEWAGHVEMHIREEYWLSHKHHLNPAYNSTILHVVWERADKSILRNDGTAIPTLILKNYVDESLLHNFSKLLEQETQIACEGQISGVSNIIIHNWLERLSIERLECRYQRVKDWIKSTNTDWERIFMIALARAFGGNVNSDAFEQLLLQIDIKLLNRYANNPTKTEALLFGKSGLLNISKYDRYTTKLKEEYQTLKKLHNLNELPLENWKFSRMRPYSFPTYRLAQLVGVLSRRIYWFEFIIEAKDLNDIVEEINKATIDDYWQYHFRFEKDSTFHKTGFSTSFLNSLAINSIIPVLFSYSKLTGNSNLMIKSLEWLNTIPAEKNNLISYFQKLGIKCSNASDSQALISMKKEYCDKKLCLECPIGLAILKR